MGLLDYILRPSQRGDSAVKAKERLQVVIAHERSTRRRRPGYLPALKKELLDVVRRYVAIEQDQIKVHVDRDGDYEVLELNIMLPEDESEGDTKS